MTTPLHQLNALGQSIWLDSISRDWLDDGSLADMVDRLGIVGVTSNPTIFAQALRSDTYDSDIARFLDEGVDDRTIFERLEVDDLRRACDVLAGVYESSDRLDGMVSIELEPDLANDTQASIERARHLWSEVDRPNLMIKVPATEAGLPVIEELIYEQINVNVTLLFSKGVYNEVMERYLVALERRQAAGLPLDVASVASFFVSRVDTAADAVLPSDSRLRGKIAVANALDAFESYRESFGGERFALLATDGARPQRPLWASTGTKNPAYSDVLYVQELILPGTVNTVPLATLEAFADHGEARVTQYDHAEVVETLMQFAERGCDLDEITEQLRTDGVASFQASYEELLERIGSKRRELAAK